MSATVQLNFSGQVLDPHVTELAIKDQQQRFLVLNLAPDVSIILPGFGTDAAANARRLASALLNASEAIERPVEATEEVTR